jgi:hypothetical protein
MLNYQRADMKYDELWKTLPKEVPPGTAKAMPQTETESHGV